MTQTGQNSAFRSRDAQEDSLTYHLGGLQAANNFRLLARSIIQEAEARGAAEERAKGEKALEEALTERDDAEDYVLKLAEEVLGREVEWSNGYDFQSALNDVSEYTADLEKKAANIAALEARVKELEAENAVLQARKIYAAPEPVPYSDPIRTMSTEQLCQRLQVLRARWDELMGSDEEMGGGSPMESMDEEMQSLENEISRRSALTREGGV